MNSKFITSTAIGLAMFATAPMTTASAQTETTIDEDTVALDVVIVTAQRREQTLLDVPVSVTAISGDTLADSNITNITEIVNLVPGLEFTRTQETRNAGFRIRGVGTQSFNEGVIGSVGTVIDGVVLGRQAQGLNDLIDIERVEVLRGPQGTLFGASTTAGLVNVVTKAPTDEFEAVVDAEYGAFNTWKTRGSISGPLIGSAVTGRLTGYVTNTDGQGGVNLVQGGDVNTRDEFGFRGKVNFDISESVNLLVIADYSDVDSNCCEATIQAADPSPVLGPLVPSEGNRDSVGGGTRMFETQETWGLAAVLDIELGDHTFTSASSYRDWDFSAGLDVDLVPLNFLDFAGTNSATEEIQQEFRLASPDAGRLRYIAGYYFFHQDLVRDSRFTGEYGGLLGGVELTEVVDQRFDRTTHAVFGQVNYDLTESFEVYGGLRYTDMEMSFGINRAVGSPIPINVIGTGPWTLDNLDHEDDNLSGTLGAIFRPVNNTSFYASYTNGYKGIALDMEAGSVNDANQNDVDESGRTRLERLRLKPEIVDSFEVGVKTLLFDGKVNINASIFQSNFQDFQSGSFDPELNLFRLLNAGELETKGFEVELFARPSDRLDLTAAIGYTDAEFAEFTGGPCFAGQTEAEGCIDGIQDLSGARLNNSPEWFVSTSAQYTAPLFETGWDGFARGEFSYRTEVVTNVNQDPLSIQDAFPLLNASLGATSPNGKYTVRVFGKNLTDEVYAFNRSGYGALLGVTNGQQAFLAPPRTWGVSVRAEF